MRMVKAASLVLDFDLYIRGNFSSSNAASISEAIRSGLRVGKEIPPVIVDTKSRRVTDGFHRVRSTLSILGPASEIGVVEKRYRNKEAMFRDAMHHNGIHGERLDTCDRVRCIIMAEQLGVPLSVVAQELHMTIAKLEDLKQTRVAAENGFTIPLKRTNQHMAGKNMTKVQVEANKRSTGMNQATYANQLIDLIESDLLDKTNKELLIRLKHLAKLIRKL